MTYSFSSSVLTYGPSHMSHPVNTGVSPKRSRIPTAKKYDSPEHATRTEKRAAFASLVRQNAEDSQFVSPIISKHPSKSNLLSFQSSIKEEGNLEPSRQIAVKRSGFSFRDANLSSMNAMDDKKDTNYGRYEYSGEDSEPSIFSGSTVVTPTLGFSFRAPPSVVGIPMTVNPKKPEKIARQADPSHKQSLLKKEFRDFIALKPKIDPISLTSGKLLADSEFVYPDGHLSPIPSPRL